MPVLPLLEFLTLGIEYKFSSWKRRLYLGLF